MNKSPFTIYQPLKNKSIYFAMFDSQYDVTSTLIRIQEFYESNSKKFRNTLFSLDDYMDWYVKTHGAFTYFSDWNGFNIPGYIIENWCELANESNDFRNKELKFINALEKQLHTYLVSHVNNNSDPWYMIATHKKANINILKHEFAHALYYIDTNYHKQVDILINNLDKSVIELMSKWLNDKGYGSNVIHDEMNAYLSTSEPNALPDPFGWRDVYKPFKDLFFETINNQFTAKFATSGWLK